MRSGAPQQSSKTLCEIRGNTIGFDFETYVFHLKEGAGGKTTFLEQA